jgi:AraC-like DNA-binding protein
MGKCDIAGSPIDWLIKAQRLASAMPPSSSGPLGASQSHGGFSLDDAAAATAANKSTMARCVQALLGRLPLSYFQDLREERAVHLLKTTGETVDEIAIRVGYADGATLRTL